MYKAKFAVQNIAAVTEKINRQVKLSSHKELISTDFKFNGRHSIVDKIIQKVSCLKNVSIKWQSEQYGL